MFESKKKTKGRGRGAYSSSVTSRGGEEPLTLVTGLHQECGFTTRLLLPWPSPKKGLLKCHSFLQQISKIKMQSHVVWGPGVTPDTQLFPSNGCATYSQPPEGPGEPVNAINHKG